MDFKQFKLAVDSMVGYHKMVGIMGGEPLLHPEFEKFCNYAVSKIPKLQLGIWTGFPDGYDKYRQVIVDTFHHIFLNDHSRGDIYHHPGLVAIEEVVPDRNKMWQCIDHCWAQEGWSASINPNGAFFCEIAASMSVLFGEGGGWSVKPGWWWRIPKDFKFQMEQYCPRCGFAAPLKRRVSIDEVDDISPGNLRRLKDRSLRVAHGKYMVSDLQMVEEPEPMASYKDIYYRNRIAERYGMFLMINESDFMTPYLKASFNPLPKQCVYETLKERWGCPST